MVFKFLNYQRNTKKYYFDLVLQIAFDFIFNISEWISSIDFEVHTKFGKIIVFEWAINASVATFDSF